MSSYNKVPPSVWLSPVCFACGGKNVVTYLSLGETALANSYLTDAELGEEEFKAPLELGYCRDCHLAQLRYVVDREALFRHYAYFSSASPQLLKHFREYAESVFERFPDQSKRLVVEIASNDGILLKPFKELGANVLGVEPAKNVAEVANGEGIPTLAEFFNYETASQILESHGQAGIITANNVLAHTDVLRDIVKGVSRLLATDGVFVFEVQYLVDLISHNEFDNTYHEHTAYFSLHPLMKLMNEFGMEIFDVEHVETQGGSLRVYAGKQPLVHAKNQRVDEMAEMEEEFGITKEETYHKFAEKPEKVKEFLPKLLKELKGSGKRVAAYGAAAKTTTLLQYSGVGKDLLEYVIDDAPAKQGKYMPGTHIPIFSSSKLRESTPDYILITAWNYAPSIMLREKWFTDLGGKFIIPVPTPRIIE